MRKQVQNQIIEILPTILEGVYYAVNSQSQQAAVVLSDCYETFNFISESLRTGLSNERFVFYQGLINELQVILRKMHERVLISQPVHALDNKFERVLDTFKASISQESEVKIEVLFMPYKSSMWDSMESIWLAAKSDERCNAVVVPIPYYDRNPDRSVGAIHYEGRHFPVDVPIVHFDDYDLSKSLPDIIYIHNPYDDMNRVTSVDPRFYSYSLKKYTNMLVYVPYFISGAYADNQVFAQKHITSCVKFVDKIIVQSNIHKELYIECGVDENKLVVLGSPKFDAIVSFDEKRASVPSGWTEKLKEKKSIVLNSSVGALLIDKEYLKKLRQRLTTILSYSDLILIWRPHPLLKSTITSMRPELYGEYMEIVRMVEQSDNAILDISGSTLPATTASDGMISDLSSWARQYIATGKPVLMLNGSSSLKRGRKCVFDHFSCYFLHDGFSIEEFCNMILMGMDLKKDERMSDLRSSIVNSDGSCGKKVNDYIVSLLR